MSSKAGDTTRDIEAQHEYDHEERESERAQLERIRSAGVFTISPELFEKVYILILCTNCSYTFNPRVRRSGISGSDLPIRLLWVSWGTRSLFDTNAGLLSQQLHSPWC